LERKKKAPQKKHATISFAGAVAGVSASRLDKAASTRTAAARTQTFINQNEECMLCEAKATPGLPPKQAARDAIGTLMEKLNRVEIIGVDGDATAIRNKGSLPTDWWNGLNQDKPPDIHRGGNVRRQFTTTAKPKT
jgi:hypothetical protein